MMKQLEELVVKLSLVGFDGESEIKMIYRFEVHYSLCEKFDEKKLTRLVSQIILAVRLS